MNEAVFISDLHLHPEDHEIHARFESFVEWAKTHTKSVYILGDFIHVWAGDDLIDAYGQKIIKLLRQLHQAHVQVYFMPGNRDFLIGQQFLEQSQMTALKDPTIVTLDGERLYLTHGDQYCTDDKAHQWFRRMTRHPLFKPFFLLLPKRLRRNLVHSVRQHSQDKKRVTQDIYQINSKKLFKDMHHHQVFKAIYGHVHQKAHYQDTYQHFTYHRYVLSDWDVNPEFLCYNKLKGLYFIQFEVINAYFST
jgi:UDP-2,3-diacylglucosamine hydrolase